ncbi:MAG: membrane bound O-acyl transferase family-domain-containing protein [Planctomycetota bacterium]
MTPSGGQDTMTTRLRGWPPLVALPLLVVVLTPASVPRWAFMWLLAFAIFCGCKWLTWRRGPAIHAAPLWRHLAYLVAWPGLDARAFLLAPPPARPTPTEWAAATARLAAGAALYWGVARLAVDLPYLAGWVGMVGLIMMLHFGSMHLMSCAWRAVGVDARPLMQRPLASTSLAEFWGRRWNTAFRDLTHRYLFKPLTRRMRPGVALLVGFLFSGVIHDAVISLPAGGGYGGPTAFFAIQALGIVAERSAAAKRLGLGRGPIGWAFAMVLLAGPACLLFHPPFVERIIVPFMQAIGALPT